MINKKIVILTGAGVSAESGIPTFRDANGLWEGHDIMEVASPQGWQRNPSLVLDFYNKRRRAALEAQPNPAHYVIAELEKLFSKVVVITQNVDDLHEKAGSTNVIHLHGSLFQMRSSVDENLIFNIFDDISLGDTCPRGSQLRPHIVWFGEPVPLIEQAMHECLSADAFVVVGTSMQVYPAAGLIEYVSREAPKYLVDPSTPNVHGVPNLFNISEKASSGMLKVKEALLNYQWPVY